MSIALDAARLPGREAGTLLAVFPPSWTEAMAFAAVVSAEGRPIRAGGAPFLFIAHGDGPDFVARLESAGAVAVYRDLPVGPVLAGCFVALERKRISAGGGGDGPKS